MKRVVIHSAARAELDEAMGFYESRAHGLGLDLQAKVEAAVTEIRQRPEAWARHKDSAFRKYFTERFPFTVFFMELPDCIWVIAIAHGSRRPGYWASRRRAQERARDHLICTWQRGIPAHRGAAKKPGAGLLNSALAAGRGGG